MGKEDNHLKIDYNSISRDGDIYIFNTSVESGVSLEKNSKSIMYGDVIIKSYLSILPVEYAPTGNLPIEIGSAEKPFYNISSDNITIPYNWLYHQDGDYDSYAYTSNSVQGVPKTYTYKGFLDAYTHSDITESDLVCYNHSEGDNIFKNSIYDIISFNFNYLLLSEDEKDFVVSIRDSFDNYIVENFILRGGGKWEMILKDNNYFYLLNNTGNSYPIGVNTSFDKYFRVERSSWSPSVDKPCTNMLYGRDTTSPTARLYLGVYERNLVSIQYGRGSSNYLLDDEYQIKFKPLNGDTKVLYNKKGLYIYPLFGSDCFFLYYKHEGLIITSVCKPLYYYETDREFGFMIEEAVDYSICIKSSLEYKDNLHEFTIKDLSDLDDSGIVPLDESNIVVCYKDTKQKSVCFTYTKGSYIENYCYDNPAMITYLLSLSGLSSVIDTKFRSLFNIRGDISILTTSPSISVMLASGRYMFDDGFTTIKLKDSPYTLHNYPGVNKYLK